MSHYQTYQEIQRCIRCDGLTGCTTEDAIQLGDAGPFCEECAERLAMDYGQIRETAAIRLRQLEDVVQHAKDFVEAAQVVIQSQADPYSNPLLSSEYSLTRTQAALLAREIYKFLDESRKDKERQWVSNLNR